MECCSVRFPTKDPKQLVVIKENDSPPNVRDIQRAARSFSQGGGINVEKMDYIGATEPVQVRVGLINAGFLETLSVQPMLGRIISPGEDVQGGPCLAMVSNDLSTEQNNVPTRDGAKTCL